MCYLPRVLSFKERNVSTRKYNNDLTKLGADSYPFPLDSQSLNQQAKKGVTVLAALINTDYQREIGLLLHSASKEEYIGDPIGHSLLLLCPVISVNEKLQPNLGRITNSPVPSGMEF